MSAAPITINGDQELNTYTVQFVGEYMSLTTTVFANDEDQANMNAQKLIYEYYGWDLTQAEVIEVKFQ